MPSHLAPWQELAASAPERLVAALTSGELPPWELSFAAEVAGDLPQARDALLTLLDHEEPTVREGAIYGLAKQIDDDQTIRERLEKIAIFDASSVVREVAIEALDGDPDAGASSR